MPKLNVEVITNTSQLNRYVRTLSQGEVDKRKSFYLTENYYETIKDRIKRRYAIEYDIVEDIVNEI